MSEDEYNHRLKELCSKLLNEVQLLTKDRANSNLPEWESEANCLDIHPWNIWEYPIINL